MTEVDDDTALADLTPSTLTLQYDNPLSTNKEQVVASSRTDYDDVPLANMSSQAPESDSESLNSINMMKNKRKANGVSKRVKSEDSSDDYMKPMSEKSKTVKRVKKEEKEESKVRSKKSAGDTAKKPKAAPAKVKKERSLVKEESSRDETPGADEEEETEEFKWWEAEQHDGTVKWHTLEHNGVLFPPPYEPLPSNVKLLYDGKPVNLPLEAEEVANFFGAMLNTDHARNPTFQKNFFNDFRVVLKECKGPYDVIKEFEKCDFTLIFEHHERMREEKKNMPAAEKKRLKAEKDKAEEKYKTCILDGRKELVGNFRIEPPGLFRGRGQHPKTGKLKRRVMPEQVTINIGKEAKVPDPPEGHHWAKVQHDNTVSWLAMWKENINDNTKYVMLAQSSSLKGMSDFKKFETARNLKNHVDRIRADYRKMLKDKLMLNRQMATATYLIDVLALRAGGEKGEDQADTVGCCSLRYEHITLKEPDIVIFDFLGKDSIRYYQEVAVDKQVFKNLKIFKKPPKEPGDDIFDRLDPSILNKHLQNYMPGLTAKVFRTYNASKTFQDQLALIPNEGTVNEKIVRYNAANREVAILCNHQRSVSKNHETSVAKIGDKISELKWTKMRLKKMMLALDKSLLKKKKGYFDDLDELSSQEIAYIHDNIIKREDEKIRKKFDKENEKRIAEGEEKLPESELQNRLKVVAELKKQYAKELATGKVEVNERATVEKLEAQVEKVEQRIENTKLLLKDKEDNSQVALGTSKMNYIDPRLTVMFSKKFGVPLEKLFTKTLREKFKWAIESADENWVF